MVGRLDIYLRLKDVLHGVVVPEGHDLVHMAKEGTAKHAWGQEVMLDPVVY